MFYILVILVSFKNTGFLLRLWQSFRAGQRPVHITSDNKTVLYPTNSNVNTYIFYKDKKVQKTKLFFFLVLMKTGQLKWESIFEARLVENKFLY